ncbi:leukocyte immunoglobulin-like receptor subfamily B member 4A isoform X3 [Peromyscus californicus insignis]|uniref:leukocyte immunoglobulin-like receptor subfamily B member 4A isoform X3 n=1 Tax=Peromyscus californicus insignis TaxID=564181 RepID=UPI0022A7CD3C|nr:leukocyte immunoglobulin-like receptor subfamily B member 4A isoform X3 [Peromyscus californicus insignis]
MTGRTCPQTENSLSDGSTEHDQAAPGAQARKIPRLTMVPMLRMLLCLGLSVGQMTAVLAEAYDKPSLSVWPSPAVTSGETITMQCSASLGFGRFILIQEGKHHLRWNLDSQQNANLEFQAHFVLDPVTTIHNGTFRCYGYYRNHPQVWSISSDPLHLLVSESKDQSPTHTENGLGRYQKVLIGVLVSLLLLFFLLILLILFRYQCKGKEKKAVHADQRETNLQLLEGDTDPTARERLPQKRSSPDAAIKEENQYASVMDPQPEESVELDSWNPPDEEPQRIVYAQVKPSMLYKAGITSSFPLSEKVLDMKNNQSGENREMYPQATTSKKPQDVTYAQLCRRTLEQDNSCKK